MDDLDQIRLRVYEYFNLGMITESDKDCFIAILDSLSDNVVFEMKSRDEYSRNKFKAKYNFKSNNNDKYKTKGNISVNGKEIPIDMSKDNYSDDSGNNIPKTKLKKYLNNPDDERIISLNSTKVKSDDNNTVILDKKFFKLKNQKRRDALLHHELTHRNFQLPSAPKNMQVPEIRKLYRRNIINGYLSQGVSIKDIRDNMDWINKQVDEILNNKPYDSINKERSAAIIKADKSHTSTGSSHINGLEKEADIGAAKATSKKKRFFKRIK